MCMISLLSSPCPTGIKISLSFYGLHHNPKVWPNPEVGWLWEGGWADLSRPTPPPVSSPGRPVPSCIGSRAWPYLSWPWCFLCRCLTLPVLHQVLIYTAMLSCPSQEDRGEASCTWGGPTPTCKPWCLWPPTFICGTRTYALVCWCVVKEALVYLYKKKVTLQATIQTIFPLILSQAVDCL